ncbi:MAG: carboxypeptidase-like regulatory domain-containing protein [archaeon]
MNLENYLELLESFKQKEIGRRKFINRAAIISAGAASLFLPGGCGQETNVTSPDEITIDPKHVGMLRGILKGSEIQGNQLIYRGLEGWTVIVENHVNFREKTKTIAEGFYSMDNVPAGSYDVSALSVSGITDVKPITVPKQQVVTVPDLKLLFDSILMGKLFQQDKTTPFANKAIQLYDVTHGCNIYYTKTDPDGSYLFKRNSSSGMIGEIFQVKSSYPDEYMKIFFMENDQETITIPKGDPHNVVVKDLFRKVFYSR